MGRLTVAVLGICFMLNFMQYQVSRMVSRPWTSTESTSQDLRA